MNVVFHKLFNKSFDFKTEKLSVKGLRSQNEDNCTVIKLDDDTYFLAVADGMGGIYGGHIASSLVLTAIEQYFRNDYKSDENKGNLKAILGNAYIISQKAISDHVKEHPEYSGMGTTLASVLIKNGKFVWGNLGDSRIYYLSGGRMRLLTEDHSYIQEYINKYNGGIPINVLSQYRNIVTRILDGGQDKPDIYPSNAEWETLKEGDLLLLCSDGLIVDKIKDYSGLFTGFIKRKRSLKTIAVNMIEWALKEGSDDNISVVIGLYGSVKKVKKNSMDEVYRDEDPLTVQIIKSKGNADG